MRPRMGTGNRKPAEPVEGGHEGAPPFPYQGQSTTEQAKLRREGNNFRVFLGSDGWQDPRCTKHDERGTLRISAAVASRLERVTGIEPVTEAWEAFVIPFHHTRALVRSDIQACGPGQWPGRAMLSTPAPAPP